MGGLILDNVINLLSRSGIRAEAAYPAERITRVTEPVAAVSLSKADQKSQKVTVQVDVLGPKESGGYICQKKALEVCAILEECGAVCCQEGCDFLSKGNVFCVTVLAEFHGIARVNALEEAPHFEVYIGTTRLRYACGFTAEQIPDSTGELQEQAFWKITLEEFFPWGILEALQGNSLFTLELRHEDNLEMYKNCKWTGKKRIAEEAGLRQIRTGIAEEQLLSIV